MASTTAVVGKIWTYTDYAALDDGKRYEILEGELVMAPAPELDHQGLIGELFSGMRAHIVAGSLGKLYVVPVDVVLDDRNVVQPDLVFVSRKNQGVLKKTGIFGVPDLVVEVLSPSSIRMDRYRKLALYRDFKIPEYWIVDPAAGSIEVLSLRDGEFDLHSSAVGTGVVSSVVLPGFSVDVAELMKEIR